MHVATLDPLMRIKLLGPASVDDASIQRTAINLNTAALKWQALTNRVAARSAAGVARPTRKPQHSFNEEFMFEQAEAN